MSVAAEDLKIKGLTQCQPASSCPPLRPAASKRSLSSRPLSSCNNVENTPVTPQLPVKTEPSVAEEAADVSDVLRPEESLRGSADLYREENDLFITEENKDFSVGAPLTAPLGVNEGNKGTFFIQILLDYS